jgi:putative inorganic carbon (hco3(-)) transporter
MLGALVLAPALLLADIWHSPQLNIVHRHPLLAAAGAAVVLAAVGAVGVLIARRPTLLGPLAILALPFRVPIEAGGTTSNLLVPLYLVVAAGALALIVPALAGRQRRQAGEDDLAPSKPGWIERLLALYVVLYALQSVYSPDFEKALQQMVFFYVPFTLLFCLLRALRWTPRLLRTCLLVAVALALVFAGLGYVEYATKTIILNPKLVAANDVHAYFTVNSVFFDPDIFGRFLALVMILVATLLLYDREPREQIGATAVLAVLWGGLVLTLSRSSLGALLVGLGTLAALRWNAWRAILVGVAVVAIGAAALAISPKTFGLNQGLNGASSGRANLVSGGIGMFGERPLWGYGSGSFVSEYRAHHRGSTQTLSASHTIAITIAAEQGLIGELVYLALVLVAAVRLIRGARSDPARAAIAAAFLALVFHTLLYADFLEDPVTWTLLGVGSALAVAARTRSEPTAAVGGAAAPVPA